VDKIGDLLMKYRMKDGDQTQRRTLDRETVTRCVVEHHLDFPTCGSR